MTTNWDVQVKVLAKHTDGTDEGIVFWRIVRDFLELKGVPTNLEESFWAYGDEFSLRTERKLKEFLKQLLFSEEFNEFKAEWLKDLNKKMVSGDLEKLLFPARL